MKKVIYKISILTIILIVAFLTMNYVIYGGQRDIQAEDADFKTTASIVSNEFKDDNDKANQKYLNRVIEVSGEVTKINKNDLTLNGTILCRIIKKSTVPTMGKTIKVKGRVVGYDDLMGEISLDDCRILN